MIFQSIALISGENVLALNRNQWKLLFVSRKNRSKSGAQTRGQTNIDRSEVSVFWRTHSLQHAVQMSEQLPALAQKDFACGRQEDPFCVSVEKCDADFLFQLSNLAA